MPDLSENDKILTVISKERQKRFGIEKAELKDVTVGDLNNLAMALKDNTSKPGYRAGQCCCCCQFCCSCAVAVGPNSKGQ